MMNDLFAALQIGSFHTILAAYRAAGIPIETMIDGGAAAGHSSRLMLRDTRPDAQCYAFEPFPGNHRFLEGQTDPRIVLRKEALAEVAKTAQFQVTSTVAADSAWGQRGMEGYSSVGFLTDTPSAKAAMTLEVPCIRADAVVDPGRHMDFIKLDLQGGELNALRGMTGFLDQPYLLWVEFGGQPGLLAFLQEADYLVFDTEYFGLGAPDDAIRAQFTVTRENVSLSNGQFAWFGFKRTPWGDFLPEFLAYRAAKVLVQTDLVCINRKQLPAFCRMLGQIAPAS
jgi:FkbM family methyltransferase